MDTNCSCRPAPNYKILYPVKTPTVSSSQPAADPVEKVIIRVMYEVWVSQYFTKLGYRDTLRWVSITYFSIMILHVAYVSQYSTLVSQSSTSPGCHNTLCTLSVTILYLSIMISYLGIMISYLGITIFYLVSWYSILVSWYSTS